MRRSGRNVIVGFAMLVSAISTVAAPHASAVELATFHGLTPARLMDTRPGQSTIDGLFAGTGFVASGSTVHVVVTNRGGVPATGVGAVALNVTVSEAGGAGYVTVFPTGSAQPTASNLNYITGQTVPNMTIVGVGTDGKVSLFNAGGSVQLVVDILGWFPTTGAFTGLNPARLLDTRPGSTTVDGLYQAGGITPPTITRGFAVKQRGGVPATGASAVVLNVTATDATAGGYLTVIPGGSTPSTASNLNFTPGATVPNMVIVPLSSGGTVGIYNGTTGSTHMIADVLGWFPTGNAFTGLSPKRLLDTRPGQATVDGQFAGIGAAGPQAEINLIVPNRAGMPADNVGAVALNVTVTAPTTAGYLTVYPTGAARPTASNLNFSAGQTIANMVIVPVGADGKITIFNSQGQSDILVDVLGWFPRPAVLG